MILSKPLPGLAACLLGVMALTGCTVEAGLATPAPAPAFSGTLTVHWTVAGTAAAVQCAYYRADGLELVIYDELGKQVATVNAPCETFTTSIDLSPGVYHADATLVGVDQKARSLTLPLNDLKVTIGTDLAIDTDFPARSFL